MLRCVEDADLPTRVATALRQKGYSPLREVDVTTKDDLVQLTGQVPTYHLKQVAQETARGVKGVLRVQNDLKVVCSRLTPA